MLNFLLPLKNAAFTENKDGYIYNYKKNKKMPKTPPFHSTNPADVGDKKVYHDNTTCQEGRAIDPKYKMSGMGNRPLCKICAKHDSDGR